MKSKKADAFEAHLIGELGKTVALLRRTLNGLPVIQVDQLELVYARLLILLQEIEDR